MNNKIIERANVLNKLLMEKEAVFSIVYEERFKNNSMQDAFILHGKNYNMAPIVYLNDELLHLENNVLVDHLERIFYEHAKNISFSEYVQKDYVIEHVLPRVVAATNIPNMEKENRAFIQYLDLAISFYIPVEGFNERMGYGTNETAAIQLSTTNIKQIGLSAEQVKEYALKNLEEKVRIIPIMDMLRDLAPFDIEDVFEGEIPMWVVTNETGINGAAAILCGSAMKKLQEKLGENFVVLPSSIHECIAVTYDGEEELQNFIDMVKSVNLELVDPEEKLTDNTYVFRGGELVPVISKQ